MGILRITLFGTPNVEIDGESILDGCGQRERELLVFLTLRAGKEVERSYIAESFWPDHEIQTSLYNLRRHLSRLRVALGTEESRLRTVKPRSLRFDLSNANVDLSDFDAASSSRDVSVLRKAVAIYQGPLAEGIHSEWIQLERHRREVIYCDALSALLSAAIQSTDWTEAIRVSRLLILVDPLREEAHRSYMQALAATGNLPAAIQVYRDLRLRLYEAINQEPDPKTAALFAQIKSESRGLSTVPQSIGQFGQPDIGSSTGICLPGRFPRSLSTLVGREMDISELQRLLTTARIVTLTGPGGVGKTRLAQALGEALQHRLRDGACFVDLSSITDPKDVETQIMLALGMELTGANPLAAICKFLVEREALIVLDNCEHLVHACAAVVNRIAVETDHVRIVATSRQILRVPGEVVWKTPSLDFPEHEVSAIESEKDQSDTLEYFAVRLFVERAKEYQPLFRLRERDLPDIARICRRLDGIPLAIELAANRLKALTVSQIAERLDDRFRMLTGGNSLAPRRQQTMESLLDWSYELLDSDERALLGLSSVFQGSWTLDALIGVVGDRFDQWDILDLLSSLADKSLIVLEDTPTGALRYKLLESIREFAWSKLGSDNERNQVKQAHGQWFFQFAEEVFERLAGEEAPALLEKMDIDRDNLRSALNYFCLAAASGQSAALETAYRFAYAMWRYWYMRCYFHEAFRVQNMIRDLPCPAELRRLRARNLNVLSTFAVRISDMNTGRSAIDECIRILEDLDDRRNLLLARSTLAGLFLNCRKFADALDIYESILPELRASGDQVRYYSPKLCVATCLRVLQRFYEALTCATECYKAFQEQGYALGEATALQVMAEVEMELGDLAASELHFTNSLYYRQKLGDREGVAYSITGLARIAFNKQDWSRSERLYRESIVIRQEVTQSQGLCETYCELARLFVASGRISDARECLIKAESPALSSVSDTENNAMVRALFFYCSFMEDWETAARCSGYLTANSGADEPARTPSDRKSERDLMDKVMSALTDSIAIQLTFEGATADTASTHAWARSALAIG